jgi:hypothetical protein
MNKTKRYFYIRIFISLVFIFSGVVKLFPIVAFEAQIHSRGIENWFVLSILARLLIIIEIFIGFGFLQKSYLKKFFIPFSALLLLVYSVDLVRVIVTDGGETNCGCFGQIIEFTSAEALIKNIFLAGLLVYLYKSIKTEKKGNIVFLPVLFIIVALPVFLLFPVKQIKTPDRNIIAQKINRVNSIKSVPQNINENIITHPLEQNIEFKENPIKLNTEEKNLLKSLSSLNNFDSEKNVDFSKGEKIIAFLSLDCDLCEHAASIFRYVNNELKLPKVYFMFLGEKNQVTKFFMKSKTSFPYKILDDMQFFTFVKKYPPRILFLKNGKLIADWNERTFTPETLKEVITKNE